MVSMVSMQVYHYRQYQTHHDDTWKMCSKSLLNSMQSIPWSERKDKKERPGYDVARPMNVLV